MNNKVFRARDDRLRDEATPTKFSPKPSTPFATPRQQLRYAPQVLVNCSCGWNTKLEKRARSDALDGIDADASRALKGSTGEHEAEADAEDAAQGEAGKDECADDTVGVLPATKSTRFAAMHAMVRRRNGKCMHACMF